jgi:hypothetical protein
MHRQQDAAVKGVARRKNSSADKETSQLKKEKMG